MINNETKTVTLLAYTSSCDAYGQVNQSTPTETSIQMFFKTFSQANVDNPKFVDVELVGLTKSSVALENRIKIDSVIYEILSVNKSKRFNEVMLRKTSQ